MINYNHPQVQADLKEILAQHLPWHMLDKKSVLVTGATGMLSAYVAFVLLSLNEQLGIKVKPILLARSEEKLKYIFGDFNLEITALVQDVCDSIEVEGSVDYIFHAAGGASPYHILNDPVGIIRANVQGTQNVLEVSNRKKVSNTVFASTREIYGRVETKESIDENDMGVLDPLHPRNCYPESKRLAEALLMAYHTQYGVNFSTLRIAHAYGPGMSIENDGRVMSDLIGDVINKRDICLNSSGQVERAFCYIVDAVSGIFRVMLQGRSAEAYNLANENESIRIVDLAYLLQRLSGNGKGVSTKIDQSRRLGYTNYNRTALNTKRLEALGWSTTIGLEEGLIRTLRSFSGISTI